MPAEEYEDIENAIVTDMANDDSPDGFLERLDIILRETWIATQVAQFETRTAIYDHETYDRYPDLFELIAQIPVEDYLEMEWEVADAMHAAGETRFIDFVIRVETRLA
jgi:hypothetical protein